MIGNRWLEREGEEKMEWQWSSWLLVALAEVVVEWLEE